MSVHTESFELAYLAVPDGGGPGVVVAHDVWGLSEHYRNIARGLAGAGCGAVAAGH
jgi:dienelactone hydrolase